MSWRSVLLGCGLVAAPPVCFPMCRYTVCRYTVRDIGFVDLSGPTYVLTHVAPEGTAIGGANRAVAESLLRSSNVELAEIDAAHGADPRAAATGGAEGWVLSRADRPALVLLAGDAHPTADTARVALDALHSPLRDGIATRALSSFATLVIAHGTDAGANARVAELVAGARADLDVLAGQLPRPIDWPLVELELERAEREAERVLLWSLGLEVDDGRPAVCVLYGRGKLAGRVMTGESITRREILAQLALVGESCECDTDRDWVGEPSLPLSWGERQRERAAQELGFDPESPLVRAEIARILDRGPEARGGSRSDAGGVEALVFGYRETALDETSPGTVEGREAEREGAAPTRVLEATAGDDWGFQDPRPEPAAPPDSEPDADPEPEKTPGALWWTFGVMLVLSMGGALAVVLRRRPE